MVSIFGAVTNTGLTEFLKLSHKEAQKAQKYSLHFCSFCASLWLLFARCLNVDVDLLRTSTSEYLISKHEQPYQYYEHKNRDYSDHADTAAATAFFGHEGFPPCYLELTGGLIVGKDKCKPGRSIKYRSYKSDW